MESIWQNFRPGLVFIITYKTVGGKERCPTSHSPMLCCLLPGFISEWAGAALSQGKPHNLLWARRPVSHSGVGEGALHSGGTYNSFHHPKQKCSSLDNKEKSYSCARKRAGRFPKRAVLRLSPCCFGISHHYAGPRSMHNIRFMILELEIPTVGFCQLAHPVPSPAFFGGNSTFLWETLIPPLHMAILVPLPAKDSSLPGSCFTKNLDFEWNGPRVTGGELPWQRCPGETIYQFLQLS